MVHNRFVFFLISLIVILQTTNAQKLKSIKGTATYVMTMSETLAEARQKAIERAKVDALIKEFGEPTISSAKASSILIKDGKTTEQFVSYVNEGELNGEWIEYSKEPLVTQQLHGDMIAFTATVVGKGRAITNNKIKFEARLLRNVPNLDNESREFRNGNRVYVAFKTPVAGYLAIYLVKDQEAFRLLPYDSNQDGMVWLNQNKQYILFSENNPVEGQNPEDIDEYYLSTENIEESETNYFYFIFSPNKIRKPLDDNKASDNNILYPATLSYMDFQKWLLENRKHDKDMTIDIKAIEIKPN